MNELLKVTTDNDRITLSARELHEFLEVSTRYNDWIKRMVEYGFSENVDYQAITQKRVTAQGNETTYVDHEITLDMAKEISMLQRNEKGKQARQYFIQLEKEWNSPEKVMARALQFADKQIVELQNVNKTLQLENSSMKPKALFADAVSASKTSILVGDLAKILKQNGINIGANRLFSELREKGYLIKRKGSDWNMPTQKSMDMGLFEIKEHTHISGNGCNVTTRTPKVTGKGQVYFVNKFLGDRL